MRPYRWLFWGFLFDIVDVRINALDVLPDIVGLIGIAIGLSVLRHKSRRFGVALTIVVVLIAAWLAGLIAPRLIIGSLAALGARAFGLGVAMLVLNLVMVFEVCAGTGELARARGHHELAVAAMQRWKVYLGAQIAGIFVLLLAFASGGAGIAALLALFFVVMIVAATAILGLMRRADESLETIV